MMRIRVAGQSHPGRVREHNEDHFCIGPLVEQEALLALEFDGAARFFHEHGLLACVADGIGGYAGGGLASRWALDALAEQCYALGDPDDAAGGAGAALSRSLPRVRELLAAKLAADALLAQAGTTLAGVLLMPPDRLAVFHAGDSRVLLFAGGERGFLRQLTVDHTPVGEAVHSGALSEADAAQHPLCGQLTRSLGLAGNTEVQMQDGLSFSLGDVLLICSDGLHGTGRGLSKVTLQEALRSGLPAAELARGLVMQAVETDGADNVTLVVVEVCAAELAGQGHAGG
jgi:serine/threonine protein phosphatase PrpC